VKITTVANTMQDFSGGFVQLDTFNKGHNSQRFDTNCKQLPAKSCIEPLALSRKKRQRFGIVAA